MLLGLRVTKMMTWKSKISIRIWENEP